MHEKSYNRKEITFIYYLMRATALHCGSHQGSRVLLYQNLTEGFFLKEGILFNELNKYYISPFYFTRKQIDNIVNSLNLNM